MDWSLHLTLHVAPVLMTIIAHVPHSVTAVISSMLSPTPDKPVLFPGIISPRIRLSNFRGQHSNDVHKEDKIELKQTKEVNYSQTLNTVGCVDYVGTGGFLFLFFFN